MKLSFTVASKQREKTLKCNREQKCQQFHSLLASYLLPHLSIDSAEFAKVDESTHDVLFPPLHNLSLVFNN